MDVIPNDSHKNEQFKHELETNTYSLPVCNSQSIIVNTAANTISQQTQVVDNIKAPILYRFFRDQAGANDQMTHNTMSEMDTGWGDQVLQNEVKHTKPHFKYEQNLNLKTHITETPYQSSDSEKCFPLQDAVQQHQRTNSRDKPYQCTQCDRCFARQGNLKQHQRTHTGEKPYQCSHCEKSFARQDNLKQHQRTHSGEKPYQCSHCEKGFARQDNLKQHQRTHTGEKPYQCSHCDKSFARQDYLKKHQRSHIGENSIGLSSDKA